MKKEPLYKNADSTESLCGYRLTADAGCILTNEIYYVYSVDIAANELSAWKEVEFFSLSHQGGI